MAAERDRTGELTILKVGEYLAHQKFVALGTAELTCAQGALTFGLLTHDVAEPHCSGHSKATFILPGAVAVTEAKIRMVLHYIVEGDSVREVCIKAERHIRQLGD